MMLQQKTKQVLGLIEESAYLPILGSLLIGFVIARSIRQPGFQEPKSYTMHDAGPLLTENLLEVTDTELSAQSWTALYGEFLPVNETPPARKTTERNSKLPTPELFVKTTPTEGGYLLSFSVTNFVIGNDGYLLLTQENNTLARIYASPYFLDTGNIDTTLPTSLLLVTNDQQEITLKNNPIQEYLNITPQE